eukprot:TRINITY_DN24649_c0_g1_i1.p1 TRINITY_DN24649_c0_g1~~TRINITY_DN24649_c0_g1_i1.p1  ORF type:complete len:202 (+),score=35.26 TRINITY_DN24649_c0_g1_i1:231-836(+)
MTGMTDGFSALVRSTYATVFLSSVQQQFPLRFVAERSFRDVNNFVYALDDRRFSDSSDVCGASSLSYFNVSLSFDAPFVATLPVNGSELLVEKFSGQSTRANLSIILNTYIPRRFFSLRDDCSWVFIPTVSDAISFEVSEDQTSILFSTIDLLARRRNLLYFLASGSLLIFVPLLILSCIQLRRAARDAEEAHLLPAHRRS